MDQELSEMLEIILNQEDGSALRLLRFVDCLLRRQGQMCVGTLEEQQELEKVAHRVLLLNPKQGWSGEEQLRFLVDLLSVKNMVRAEDPKRMEDFERFCQIDDWDALLQEKSSLEADLKGAEAKLQKAESELVLARQELDRARQSNADREVNQRSLIETNQRLTNALNELAKTKSERDRIRSELEQARLDNAAREVDKMKQADTEKKLKAANDELAKLRQERDQLKGRVEDLQKTVAEQQRTERQPVVPAGKNDSGLPDPKPLIVPKAFTLSSLNDTIPINVKSIKVEGIKAAKRYLFSDLYELRQVDFGESVCEIPRFTIYQCNDVELIFRNKDCRILSGKQSAFYGTEIKRIIAPAGGAVEEYARRENIPFDPLR